MCRRHSKEVICYRESFSRRLLIPSWFHFLLSGESEKWWKWCPQFHRSNYCQRTRCLLHNLSRLVYSLVKDARLHLVILQGKIVFVLTAAPKCKTTIRGLQIYTTHKGRAGLKIEQGLLAPCCASFCGTASVDRASIVIEGAYDSPTSCI